jgi:hypothetical protein
MTPDRAMNSPVPDSPGSSATSASVERRASSCSGGSMVRQYFALHIKYFRLIIEDY